MAVFVTEIAGGVSQTPAPGQTVPSGTVSIPFQAFKQSSTRHHHSVVTGSGAADAVLSMGPVTNAKFLLIQKQNNGTLKLKITTADGAQQIVPVGRMFVLDTPDKPVTAILFTFSGDFEVFLSEW